MVYLQRVIFRFLAFVPLDYTPENMVITEEPLVDNEAPPLPETEQPKIPDLPEPPHQILLPVLVKLNKE